MSDTDSRVFVVQESKVRRGGTFVPQFDLSPALEFGDIVYLFPYDGPGPIALSGDVMLTKIEMAMAKHRFSDNDFLLLTGSPIVMAVAAVAVSRTCGVINLLRWDKRASRYLPYKITQQS